MSKVGKIRFDAKSKRYFVDLYWQGKRERLYKHMGHMPCRVVEMAEFLLQDIRREIDKGIFDPERYRNRRPVHLAEYAENWLESLDVAAATLHDYKNSLNNHILPKLGTVFLSDITADKLKKFQNKIDRAPKGKKNVMDCLKMIMRAAHDSGHIAYMPKWPTLKVRKPAIRWLSHACNLLNSGIDKGVIQRLLRHSDPKMVDRYAEYATNSLRIKLDNVFSLDRQQTVSKAKTDVLNI